MNILLIRRVSVPGFVCVESNVKSTSECRNMPCSVNCWNDKLAVVVCAPHSAQMCMYGLQSEFVLSHYVSLKIVISGLICLPFVKRRGEGGGGAVGWLADAK